MKKLFGLVALVVAMSYGSFAQSGKMKDCMMMKDGKMMVVKDGKTMSMNMDMTLGNGTMVMKDGTVKMKDGSTQMLKEGQYIDKNGKVGMMKMDKMGDGKMGADKMKKDSTR
jgi:hypothetical protein